jgi:hypothetical protein
MYSPVLTSLVAQKYPPGHAALRDCRDFETAIKGLMNYRIALIFLVIRQSLNPGSDNE